MEAKSKPPRIYSIDVLKGICMFFMIIDHWRDGLARTAQTFLGVASPLPIVASNLEYVETASFWLRCTSGYLVAPSFIFLAGAGCYLWQKRHPNASFFNYSVLRGIMLAILNCLLFFSSPFSAGGSITLHVLWPMGLGMILLGCISKCPQKVLWAIAVALLVGQHFFEAISFESPYLNTLWTLAFIENHIALPWGASLYNLWPFMSWFGMMLLGYLCGNIFLLYSKSVGIWLKLGLTCLGLFLFFRLTGIYGDPNIWQIQDTMLKTIGNLITVNKYPPSFQYTLYGLAGTFLALAFLERFPLKPRMLIIYGATPLFFYVAHLIVIRGIRFIILRLPSSIIDPIESLLFSTSGIYLGTVLIALTMWFMCEQYKKLMKNMRDKKKVNP